MDDLDHAIVQQLQMDGRKAFTEIAQKLGVSEGTVRNRYSRLTEEGVFQVLSTAGDTHLGHQRSTSFSLRL